MQESSVAFNLSELMQLEERRILDEQRRRERVGAETRLRHEQAARAEDARKQREREAATLALAQAETAREASLLRVRLEARAAEHAERERLTHEHALQLRRLQAPERRWKLASLVIAGLAAPLLCVAGLYLAALRPALHSARQLADSATHLAEQRALELHHLRAALGEATRPDVLPDRVPERPTANQAPPTTGDSGPSAAAPARPPRVRDTQPTAPANTPAHDALLDIDLLSDDPLQDLATPDDGNTRRRTARRRRRVR